MNQGEQMRLKVLNSVLEHAMDVKEAAHVLGLSERHTWRILAAYRREGAASLVHGNRGREPANAISDRIKKQVLTLASTTYQGFNHTHLTEVLAEQEGLTLSRCTVRNILVRAGLKSPRRRRPPRHRMRRERMPGEGMLLQIDGSFHDWLEGRGPWLTLLLAVDDATGKVPYAIFGKQEDTYGYFLLLEGIIRQQGIPLAVYHDRHAALGQPSSKPQVEYKKTQFGRALQELGVKQIFAKSPEAKGRVERIAGTFQDRLVSELRLTGASSLTEANSILWGFLPRFNERFGVLPLEAEPVYRALSPEVDLEAILCYKYTRKVARDNTVKYQWRTLQLLPEPGEPSRAGSVVEVQERLDSSLVVCHKDRILPTQEAPPRAGVLRAQGLLGARNVAAPLDMVEQVVAEAPAHTTPLRVFSEGQTSRQRSRQGFQRHQPTPRQQARWDAIRTCRERGLSMRAIARELGISRNTVRNYVYNDGPTCSVTTKALPQTTALTDKFAYHLT